MKAILAFVLFLLYIYIYIFFILLILAYICKALVYLSIYLNSKSSFITYLSNNRANALIGILKWTFELISLVYIYIYIYILISLKVHFFITYFLTRDYLLRFNIYKALPL